MNSKEFARALGELLDAVAAMDAVDLADAGLEDEANDLNIAYGTGSVESYEAAGFMGYNDGLVVRTSDGSEFQVTIVRSR